MALWLWIPLAVLAWTLLSLPVAIVVGRAIREEPVPASCSRSSLELVA